MRSIWKRMGAGRVLTLHRLERRTPLERSGATQRRRHAVGARAEDRAGGPQRVEAERLERAQVELATRNPLVAQPSAIRNHLVADRAQRVPRPGLLHVPVHLAEAAELVEEAAELVERPVFVRVEHRGPGLEYLGVARAQHVLGE